MHHPVQVALEYVLGGLLGAENAVKVERFFCMFVLDGRVVHDLPLAALCLRRILVLIGKWLNTHAYMDVVVNRVLLVERDQHLRGYLLLLFHIPDYVFKFK